eukprot:2215508-Amphidinium_carterae.1
MAEPGIDMTSEQDCKTNIKAAGWFALVVRMALLVVAVAKPLPDNAHFYSRDTMKLKGPSLEPTWQCQGK